LIRKLWGQKIQRRLYGSQVRREQEETAELETMLFMCSLAMNNGKEAANHLNELYNLNKKAAEEPKGIFDYKIAYNIAQKML
jgi:hypothetical protein